MSLTPNEAEHAADLLSAYADELGNHGCNDYEIDNTDENWALVESAEAWNRGVTVEEWRKSDDAYTRPSKNKKIVAMDWFLAGYLSFRLYDRK